MRRVSRFGFSLVLACAIGAAGASTALGALPEFKTCGKVGAHKGKYASKTCSTGGGSNSWERRAWNLGSTALSVKKTGEMNLYFYSASKPAEPWAGGTVEDKVGCTKGAAAGQLTGANTLELTFHWQGCAERSKEACASTGAAGGSINSMPLVGTLGYLNSATPTAGVVLEPKSGTALAEFKCFFPGGGLSEWSISGAVIGQVEGIVNKASKKWKLAFRANTGTGAQEWTGFNGSAGSSYLINEVSSPVCHPCHSPAGFAMTAGVKSASILVEG
jgi:hypothetical protein